MVPRKSFLWCFKEFFQVVDLWIHHSADAYGEDVFHQGNIANVGGVFLFE